MIKRVEVLNKGQKMKGVLYLRRKAPLIIMCHGFTGHKNLKFFVLASQMLYKEGYSVLRFDFRGSGESEGNFISIKEEISDFAKIVKFARHYSRKLIFLGHCMGGTIIVLSKIFFSFSFSISLPK